MFSPKLFSDNWTKSFWRNPEFTWELRRGWKCWGTLEDFFQVMRVVLNYRKGQKQLKKMLYIRRVPWPATYPIYDRARPEMLSTVSPGNPVDITKPRKLFLCNRVKSLSKSRQRFRKPIFWQFSKINPWKKFAPGQNLHENSLFYLLLNMLLFSSHMYHFV